MTNPNSVDFVFEEKAPELRVIFDQLVDKLKQFREVKMAPKQTSIHLEKNSGFAGVHPRKTYFNLEFRTDYKIDDPRIIRVQQLSARRFEHTVKLERERDIDEQLLKDAHELSK